MRLIVIHGECCYLRDKQEANYLKDYQDIAYLNNLKSDKEFVRYGQRGLLATITLNVVRSSEEHLSRWKALAKNRGTNDFLFNCRRKSLTVTFKKLLEEMEAETIACPDPKPYSYLGLIARIASEQGLDIDTEGRQALIEACGYDLDKIVGEINKLRWIFGRKILGRDEIAPHLGLLREDQCFAVIDLLLVGKYSEAQLVVENLNRQGESSLAILGTIAYCLRNVLTIAAGQPLTKLPPRIVERYRNYRQHDRAKTVLDLCQRTDMALKTSTIRDDLAIYNIIDMLRSE